MSLQMPISLHSAFSSYMLLSHIASSKPTGTKYICIVNIDRYVSIFHQHKYLHFLGFQSPQKFHTSCQKGMVFLALHSLRIPLRLSSQRGGSSWGMRRTHRSAGSQSHTPNPPRSSAGCWSRLTRGTQGQGQCDRVTATGTLVTPLPTLCLQSYCNILPLPTIASLVNLCLIKLSSLYQINKRNLLIQNKKK